MTTFTKDIKQKIDGLSALEKIILCNIVVFFSGNFFALLNIDFLYYLILPNHYLDALQFPWTYITYGFVHIGFSHLFFNMLVLYFISRSFSNLFDSKLTLNIYILGIIFGGIAFSSISSFVNSQLINTAGPLLGASAGVRALLMFLCFYMPKFEVRFFTFNIQLQYLCILMVVLDFPALFSSNGGGSIAHFGGYFLGILYAIQLRKGNDLGKIFNFLTSYKKLFYQNSKLKTVYKSKKQPNNNPQSKDFKSFNKQKKIDIILDKISKSGYESLTKAEKDFLFRAGK